MRLRTFYLLFTAAVLVTAVILPQQQANAFAAASNASYGCSSLTASGTTDAPYVTLYAYDGSNYYFTILASSGGTYAGTLSYPAYTEGTVLNFQIWGTLAIYTNFSDPNYWDGGSYVNVSAACVNTSAGGPYVPAGWTQHWMTCSSAVFDAPGGNPIGSNAVWAGQSFYVNPETKTDASGKSWSQVFVSSAISPWIPTSCVG